MSRRRSESLAPLASRPGWLSLGSPSRRRARRSLLGLFALSVFVGLLAGTAFWLDRHPLPLWDLVLAAPRAGAPTAEPPPLPAPAYKAPPSGMLIRAALAQTEIPERPRLEIITYTVQPGDTVHAIAKKFGVSPETVVWANGDLELHPDILKIGQELVILPVSGVYYQVQEGDTLEAVAKKFKADPQAIATYHLNHLSPPYTLTPGQMLVIPGGEKPYVPRRVHQYTGPIPADASKGTGAFGWPVSGRITQIFWNLHRAVDIGAPAGTPVVAADSGFVVYAGWDDSGYGNLIILDHGNGYVTLYAHLAEMFVSVGQSVAKGTRIGSVGSTGNSTGPHLHFEIRYHDVQRNPLGFLPVR